MTFLNPTSWLTSSAPNATSPHPSRDLLSNANAPLFALPSELIHYVLSFLDAQDLTALRATCHELRVEAEQEKLWLDLLRPHVPAFDFPTEPPPGSTYREVYLSHSPRWHLPRYKIWFSDDAYTGKLILIKFDARRGSIEGYRLTAEKPEPTAQQWSYNPNVMIHFIEPRVYASIDDPVISMPLSLPGDRSNRRFSRGDNTPFPELRMHVGRQEQRIYASLMLSRDLPLETANSPSVAVWPPRTIPDMSRTRSSSSSRDKFESRGHKPQTLEEISQTTFRMHTWSPFTQGMSNLGVRLGEEISTWSTLDPMLYTPTPTKPYQGIYVGDYAAHGCEFLLVMQTTQAPPRARGSINHTDGDDGGGASILRRRNYMAAVLAALTEQSVLDDEDVADLLGEIANVNPHVQTTEGDVTPNIADPDGEIHRGAIEAVKLTGDVNVPRGEHTFIADDIGPDGQIRVAAEYPFTGARVVKSRGHVAARGFRDGKFGSLNCFWKCLADVCATDEFIPSQLFLIDENTLAQYWLPFGHISFYRRIDIDDISMGAMRLRRNSE